MRDSVASTAARLVRWSWLLLVLLGLVVACKAWCSFSDYASDATEILLNGCGLTTINKTDLTRFTSLKLLRLERNQLTTFPDLTAVGHTLEELGLYKNQITTISDNVINHLRALKYLVLTWNRLTAFPNVSASGNTLIELYLYGNQITHISGDVFIPLTALEFLSLVYNRLTAFPNVTASGNTLKKLILHGNQIENFGNDVLMGLTAMEYLSISENPTLTRLPHPAHMRNINKFEIEDTSISHLPPILLENIATLSVNIERSVDVCLCENAWLKQEGPRMASFRYDDAQCGGQLWSTMTLQDMLDKCAHQRTQETKRFARAKAVPPKMSLSPFLLHSFANRSNEIECTEKCMVTPGCVSFYWRDAPCGAGDCVLIAPGNSIRVSSVPGGNLPVWMYFALT